MESSKLEEILEKIISKTSYMLDEKSAKFEHSLRHDVVNLRNNLNNVKELNKKELSKVRDSVNDIEDGQKSIEKEFEEKNKKIKDLIKDNKKCSRKTNDYITKSKPFFKVRKKTK